MLTKSQASFGGAGGEWLIWQWLDSAFPTGGFAHSGGLEAAWQHGHVRDEDGVASFIRESLWQAAHQVAPFVMAAYDDRRRLIELDALLDSILSNHVANRASRQQGQALLSTAEHVFGDDVGAMRTEMLHAATPGHLAVMFGGILGILRAERHRTAQMFLFALVRGLFSAGVRLNLIGPIHAQRMQASLADEFEQAACVAERIGLGDVTQTAPLLELFQGGHDRLYSRLFQS